jgi:hypothetical protein
MGKFMAWVEAHPAEAGIIGVGGVLVIMWLLGFFSSSSSSSSASAGTANMAASYYAAEAQQAVVGGQIQIANIQANASTAQALAGDTAAVSINKAQTKAATTINGQNAATTVATTNSNNAAATTIAQSNANASLLSQFMGSILPAEFATYGAKGIITSIPGLGTFQVGGALSPAEMMAAGYSSQAIAAAGG